LPAALAVAQLGFVFLLFAVWPALSWGARIGWLLLYALSVGWNLNSIAHNFIHNPFFRSNRLNRLMSLIITLALVSPQTMYRYIHLKHHAGNADPGGEQLEEQQGHAHDEQQVRDGRARHRMQQTVHE